MPLKQYKYLIMSLKMPKVIITTDDLIPFDVKQEYPMIDMCEEYDTSILFGCRDGACGACMIRVKEKRKP